MTSPTPMKILALLVPLFLLVARLDSQDKGQPSFRSYDVRDLLSRPPDFRSGEILGVRKVDRKKSPDSQSGDGRSAARREFASGRLSELIRASLTPERGEPDDLRMHDGQLLLTATGRTHKALARLLSDLRRERALGVRVEAAVIPVGEDALATLPPPLMRKLRRAAFEGVLPHALRVTEEEVDALLASVPEDLAEVVTHRVTARNHQVSYIAVITQAAITTDVKVSRQDGQTTAEPVIGILNTGTVVQIEPAVSDDRRSIALGLDVKTAKLRRSRVIMANELERFKGVPEVGEWPIEIPELERSTLKTTVNLPAGVWVLVGSLRSDGDDESASLQAVLIRAAIVEPR